MANVRARVGARLRQLRLERRLTQEQLAEASDLSSKFIGEVERGVGNPTLTTLDAVTSALGVDVGELFNTESTGRLLTAHELTLAREALQSLDGFVRRATPSPDLRSRVRRRTTRP